MKRTSKMKTKQLCDNTYKDLLARLGELTIQKTIIDKQVAEINAQLILLNALAPELQRLEKEL